MGPLLRRLLCLVLGHRMHYEDILRRHRGPGQCTCCGYTTPGIVLPEEPWVHWKKPPLHDGADPVPPVDYDKSGRDE